VDIPAGCWRIRGSGWLISMTMQISICSGYRRGFEIHRGKDQIQPRFEENIASHFKREVEVLIVVDDVVTA